MYNHAWAGAEALGQEGLGSGEQGPGARMSALTAAPMRAGLLLPLIHDYYLKKTNKQKIARNAHRCI